MAAQQTGTVQAQGTGQGLELELAERGAPLVVADGEEVVSASAARLTEETEIPISVGKFTDADAEACLESGTAGVPWYSYVRALVGPVFGFYCLFANQWSFYADTLNYKVVCVALYSGGSLFLVLSVIHRKSILGEIRGFGRFAGDQAGRPWMFTMGVNTLLFLFANLLPFSVFYVLGIVTVPFPLVWQRINITTATNTTNGTLHGTVTNATPAAAPATLQQEEELLSDAVSIIGPVAMFCMYLLVSALSPFSGGSSNTEPASQSDYLAVVKTGGEGGPRTLTIKKKSSVASEHTAKFLAVSPGRRDGDDLDQLPVDGRGKLVKSRSAVMLFIWEEGQAAGHLLCLRFQETCAQRSFQWLLRHFFTGILRGCFSLFLVFFSLVFILAVVFGSCLRWYLALATQMGQIGTAFLVSTTSNTSTKPCILPLPANRLGLLCIDSIQFLGPTPTFEDLYFCFNGTCIADAAVWDDVLWENTHNQLIMLVRTYHFIIVTILAAITAAFCLYLHVSPFKNLHAAAEAFVWTSTQPHEQRQANFVRKVLRAIDPGKLRNAATVHYRPEWLPVLSSDPSQWLHQEPQFQVGQWRVSPQGPPWKWWFRLYGALISELQWTWGVVRPVLWGLAIIWLLTLSKILAGLASAVVKSDNFKEALKQATPSIVVFAVVFGIPLLLNIFVSCLVNDAVRKSLDMFHEILMREDDLQYLLRARRDLFQLRLLGVPMDMNMVKGALVSVSAAIISIMSK